MEQELRRKVERLCHAVLERAPDTRQAYLANICGADIDLRKQVELRLAKEGAAGSFLEEPTIDNEDTSVTLTPARSLLGQQFGPYQIVSPLGAGGMGEVYRALDARLGREVAIKISQERFSARFEREARAISSLNHPHICTLYDVGPNYLVMELVEGETMRDWLKRAPAVDRFSSRTGQAPLCRRVGDSLNEARQTSPWANCRLPLRSTRRRRIKRASRRLKMS